jgi:8-oxo-dGTP pyrophosphatase MutT (NUDIX family)
MIPVRWPAEPSCALSTGVGLVHSNAMGDRKSGTNPPSAKLFRLSHVRKLRECEQVAAVCYRLRGAEIDFLLVRTGSGHWTFPKGGVEPGLTHAQAAALEAFEEAGVHGRIEEVSFIRYVRRKRRGARVSAGDTESEVGTSAHLCEVLRLVRPQEHDRNPTWFPVEKTKKKLLEGRTAAFGLELIRVVDRAVGRIQRLRHTLVGPTDALQRVQFEAAPELAPLSAAGEASFVSHVRSSVQSRSTGNAVSGRNRGKLLQIGPTLVVNAVSVQRLPGAAASDKAEPQFVRLEDGRAAKGGAKASVTARKKRD